MSSNRKLIAVMLSTVMLLSVVGPGLAAAEEVEPTLNIEVTQDENVEITVSDDGEGVEGASVDVAVLDEDADYEGVEDLTTNENGTVVIDAPEETVNVSISATYDGETVETKVTLDAGGGEEEADSDGPFGQKVMDFVHSIIHDGEGEESKTIGQQVAEFVTQYNPGNAPDHAGPSGDQGPPEHAGPSDDDDRQGPPAHAGPPGADATDDDTNEEEADDGEEGEEENGDGDDDDEDDTEK